MHIIDEIIYRIHYFMKKKKDILFIIISVIYILGVVYFLRFMFLFW